MGQPLQGLLDAHQDGLGKMDGFPTKLHVDSSATTRILLYSLWTPR